MKNRLEEVPINIKYYGRVLSIILLKKMLEAYNLLEFFDFYISTFTSVIGDQTSREKDHIFYVFLEIIFVFSVNNFEKPKKWKEKILNNKLILNNFYFKTNVNNNW